MPRGSAIASTVALIITGVIIADILIHPVGTQAAANSVATVSKPAFSALLGEAP